MCYGLGGNRSGRRMVSVISDDTSHVLRFGPSDAMTFLAGNYFQNIDWNSIARKVSRKCCLIDHRETR